MFELTEIFLSFITLTILEIVLGIDNLIFLAIISRKLPQHQQAKARKLGLTFAWVTRLLLLASALWLTKLTHPIFTLFQFNVSGRDIFLAAGGLFLLYKATQEIYADLETQKKIKSISDKHHTFSWVVAQIAVLDIVFSLDSVLTAIGLTTYFWLMVAAITIAIIAMIFASEPLSHFIEKHPSIKMLALAFLVLVGIILIADGFHIHVPRAYIYFAMIFSLFVEILNLLRRRNIKN